MRVCLLVLMIMLSTSVLAGESLILKSRDQKSYQFFDKSGVRVSESCLKGPCEALKTPPLRESPKTSKSFTGHPAARFCEEQKAVYIIAKRESGDEDGICLFKDKSFILAWDYYRYHAPRDQK